MLSRRRILITGPSGSIGYEVLKQLANKQESFDLILFDLPSRVSKKRLKPFLSKHKVIWGDIRSYKDIEPVCSNVDIVIHMAAVLPPRADDEEYYAHEVNVDGTANLISGLKVNSPDAFLIYTSSIAVYGDRLENPMITVKDLPRTSLNDNYAKTKLKAEELVKESTLKWSILRLTAIMGDHGFSRLMFHMPLTTLMEIATIEDTGRALVNSVDHLAKLSGKIYNLGGGETCRSSYNDFLKRTFLMAGLGDFNLPDKCFAEKNFHCGYYEDSHELNAILDFQQDDLEAYFDKEIDKIHPLQKNITVLLRHPIKRYLQSLSEPLRAHRTGNLKLIEQFFGA